ncbi:MAG TPA: sulfite oxidase [Xanthobacteraceae bacterium]|nr:sulfite oxidase [Xanthobacteraceae bacterium]
MSAESERRLLTALKPRLHAFDDDALNAEPAAELLDDFITPVEHFFVRNNGRLPPEPAGDTDTWTLQIDGEVERTASFSVAALRSQFESVTVTAVLECAGYGRDAFDPPVDGVQWGRGPVGCARWTGVRLGDVLKACGVKRSAVYTAHHSGDLQVDADNAAISRGIPIAKAMSPETLLAFEMSGAPLPFLHGGPLRVVAPGFPGSAWQKWLTRLELRDREHDGAKMNGTDYRLPRRRYVPGEAVDERDFDVIVDMPVNSIITSPRDGFDARGGKIDVRGFAWSGHVPVRAVEVSTDGERWLPAQLEPEVERFAWRRFRASINVPAGPLTVMARATDAEGHTQPLEAPWNPRGYCNNAVHRVRGRP